MGKSGEGELEVKTNLISEMSCCVMTFDTVVRQHTQAAPRPARLHGLPRDARRGTRCITECRAGRDRQLSSQDGRSIVDRLRSVEVVDGRNPKSAKVRAKFSLPGRRGDAEVGGRRGWSVQGDRALLVDRVRRRAAGSPGDQPVINR